MPETAAEKMVRDAIVHSPFATMLGVRELKFARDEVELALDFRPELITYGDTMHGGVISSLIDIAATAAVWTGAEDPASRRGATVALT
ncbi:MAG: PaaI family thioesterase, partial [Candidatus Binataceae bacterium]